MCLENIGGIPTQNKTLKQRRCMQSVVWVFVGFCMVLNAPRGLYAQVNMQDLQARVEASITFDEAVAELALVVDAYVENKQFNALYEYLQTLEKNVVLQNHAVLPYYKALARFDHLRYLEEQKNWEEYFNSKDIYSIDINEAFKAIQARSISRYDIALKAKLLEWRVRSKNEEDVFEISEALYELAQEIAKNHLQYLNEVKSAADELLACGEPIYAKKLYSVYISHVADSDISQEALKAMAQEFLEEGNNDLAVAIYDAYIDRLIQAHQGKSFIIQETRKIIDVFAHTGWNEGRDPFFAEELFLKLEHVYTSDAFNGQLQYMRAYNLEKMQEYASSVKEYVKLIQEFGEYQFKDRIYFRLGILCAYMLHDRLKAREYLTKILTDYAQSQDYDNSAYHLGLLAQWEGDTETAQKYYVLLARDENGQQTELQECAAARLEEIKGNKDIEYNLRSFLQVCFDAAPRTSSVQANLSAAHAKEYSGNDVSFQVNTYLSQTGCLQQDYAYLWSGQLGENRFPFNKESFQTSYQEQGTKVVTVALVDASGIAAAALEIVDIYNKE